MCVCHLRCVSPPPHPWGGHQHAVGGKDPAPGLVSSDCCSFLSPHWARQMATQIPAAQIVKLSGYVGKKSFPWC